MVLIYHFEENQAFGPAAAELLQAAEDSHCRLVVSIIGRLEVLVLPKREGRHDLCRRYREVFESFPNLAVHPVDVPVAERASDLRAAHTLRTPDAIHLATALHHGADAFVTEDVRHVPDEVDGLPVLSMRAALERVS
ncbi:MAG: PIN domain-containing protein [Acidobacteriota bacterium]|jgi:predicted nucleic acid-binding protein